MEPSEGVHHMNTDHVSPAGHYGIFPRNVGQTLHHHKVQELHLTFTQGSWSYEHWGYPYQQSAGGGVEMWAWLDGGDDIDSRWISLTNTYAGLFCASLNFIDNTITVQPEFSFKPEGDARAYRTFNASASEPQVRYGALPHESVCTENLTPWKKLLPCKDKAGIASLLNAHKLYDTAFHSMSVHVRQICGDDHCHVRQLELKQTISSVFDPLTATGSPDWSLSAMYGAKINMACPIAEESTVVVDMSHQTLCGISGFEISPKPHSEGIVNVYDLRQDAEDLDIRMTWNDYRRDEHALPEGHGQQNGGLTTVIKNHHSQLYPVTFFDTIPWYLKLYLHTLHIETITNNGQTIRREDIVKTIHYQPAVDRSRPTVLEMQLDLPPNSVTQISINFDKVFLKYTEHRPDANRGFDVGGAVLCTLDPKPVRIYTSPLLISLPTPDFSMPYNVITMTCTVIALFFGSYFNLLTRVFSVRGNAKSKTD
ncbi:hypothetical protein BZG36_01366 [Bifiguratus adelaidae]|uniref:GPI transamidase component PIG-T n=1 Tax=Bifiguratus adelaidae TaxID=1938954 RepID=A0A261Y3D5_9FUNG|nr:hypothetical protein BZG36_01366 [Bifiguratus adelaidae]